MGKKVEFLRATFVHALYMIYYGILFWRLGKILESFPEYKRAETIGAGVAVAVIFFLLQVALIVFAVSKKYRIEFLVNQTWLNVPMLCFIIFSIGPYGMALHHQYLDPELSSKLPHAINTTAVEKSCFSVSKI